MSQGDRPLVGHPSDGGGAGVETANPVKAEAASKGSLNKDHRKGAGETAGVWPIPNIVGRDVSTHEAALPCFADSFRKLVH